MTFACVACALLFIASNGEYRTLKQDSPATGLSENDISAGWISLFDGKSLYGWKPTTQANWKVENQTIVVSGGKPGLLRTTTQFDNYSLKLEFKADSETNSGVFVRTSPKPRSPTEGCYEVNIAPKSNPFPTGSIVGRKKFVDQRDFESEKWHQLTVVCRDDSISIAVDDKTTATFKDSSPLGKGFIGLQLNSGKIRFRNIFLKPLNLEPIFNGTNLNGWKTYPAMKSKFTVEKNELLVKDGPGQLETKKKYENFALQLGVKTNAPKLNSGIFFRCIPGEKMNGYESQIQNGFKNNDRTQPEDCGTGGIFRRKNARRVVADDQKWFVKTIIADGPHIATWVNGVQVCDWTDTRKPDKNPRRGLRKEAGTIMIQGHDPTTDIAFKDLRIRELSPRKLK